MKLRVAVLTQTCYFALHFLKLYSFRALGNGRILMAITRQHVAYFPKMALLFAAQGLLDTLISKTTFFGKGD